MEFQTNGVFLPLSNIAQSKPSGDKTELEEVQILCGIAYRAVYGVNLSSSIKSDVRTIREAGRYTEQLNHLKNLIYEENWKLKQIFFIEEFRMVYQKIFSDKLNDNHPKPFDPSAVFERFLEHFEARFQPLDGMAGELDVEQSKKYLRDLYEEVSSVKGKLDALQNKLENFFETAKLFSVREKAGGESQGNNERNQNLQSTDAESTRKNSNTSSKTSGEGSKTSDSVNEVNIFQSDEGDSENEGMEIDYTKSAQRSDSATGYDKNETKGLKKKPKPLLKKSATDKLKKWFLEHIEHPYPTKETKEELCRVTGLTKSQLQNWFTNARKRFLDPVRQKLEKVASTLPTKKHETTQRKSELQMQENLPLKSQGLTDLPQTQAQSQTSGGQQDHIQTVPTQNTTPMPQGQIQIVQNHSILIQSQQIPTGFFPISGIQPNHPTLLPMMNGPLVQQPYYQSPIQLVPVRPLGQQLQPQIGSMRPIPQFQAPVVQQIPQFVQTMPLLVAPTFMMVDPKTPNNQQIGHAQLNPTGFLPIQPTFPVVGVRSDAGTNFSAITKLATFPANHKQ